MGRAKRSARLSLNYTPKGGHDIKGGFHVDNIHAITPPGSARKFCDSGTVTLSQVPVHKEAAPKFQWRSLNSRLYLFQKRFIMVADLLSAGDWSSIAVKQDYPGRMIKFAVRKLPIFDTNYACYRAYVSGFRPYH